MRLVQSKLQPVLMCVSVTNVRMASPASHNSDRISTQTNGGEIEKQRAGDENTQMIKSRKKDSSFFLFGKEHIFFIDALDKTNKL